MAQRTKRIALDRSYLPIDPNTLPETMHDTGGEDSPEARIPVIPFEGWNFMPTGYGWRSYFGIDSSLNIDALALPARCRELFTFQRTNLTHFLVALCDTGIWTKDGESSGAWTQAVTLTDPNNGTLLQWNYVILENTLFVYRQGEASAYKCASPGFAFVAHTPNTLNMAGQLGIFKAGNRLGFWDSADAIGVSALADFTDFAPSISTLANIFTIKDKIGKIVNILQHGEGWIVYATKSIISVQRDPSNSFLWKARPISNIAGIAYRHQACYGSPDTEHFAWTSIGLMRIRNFEAEIIAPELYDFLKESQDPLYLRMLEGRYLAVQLANANYVDGIVSFYVSTIPAETFMLSEGLSFYDEIASVSLESVSFLQSIEQNISGIANAKDPAECIPNIHGKCIDKDYPVYRDWFKHESYVNPLASITDLSNYTNIDTAINDAVKDILNFRLLNILTNLAPNDPRPFTVNTTVKDGVTEVLEEDLFPVGTPAYFEDISNNNFFSKFIAITAAFERLATAWLASIDNLLTYSHGRKFSISTVTEGLVPFLISDALVFPLSSTDMDVPFADIVEAKPLAQNPSKTLLHIEVKHGFAYELGVMNDRIPWGIARHSQVSVRDASYSATKKINSFILRTIDNSGVGRPFTGFTYPDTPFTTTAEFRAVLEAIKVSLASYSGLAVAFGSGYPPLGRPYANFSGGVSVDSPLADTRQSVDMVPATGYDGFNLIILQIIATSLTTEDTFSFVASTANPANVCSGDIALMGFSYPDSYIRYDISDNIYASPNIPPESVITGDPSGAFALDLALDIELESVCDIVPAEDDFPRFNKAAFNSFPFNNTIINTYPVIHTLATISWSFVYHNVEPEFFTFPAITFLMQVGTPAPYDVLWKGAYVYDTQLKRWGKLKADYRQLLDFSPLNSTSLGIIPYTNFGISGALLDDLGEIHVFDANPADSYIKFGKYGNFRHGFTTLELIRADFRIACTGQLQIESSLDGKSVEYGTLRTYDYTDVIQIIQGHNISARWHNVAFKGQFDLTYLELTSWSASRR
jgi:hypothetical protein